MFTRFGYSLIELLLVLSIVAGFVIMSVQSNHELYLYSLSQGIVNRLLSAIRLTRMQAVVSGDKITFCGSSNGLSCDENWQAGQIIIDNQTHKLLRVFPALPPSILLTWRGSGHQPYLTFQASGFTNGQQGRFNICLASESINSRAIIINHSGRARISDDALCRN